jgi:hypothetical protein
MNKMARISIDCEASANYDDRKTQMPNVVYLTREKDLDDDMEKKIWIDIEFITDRPDDSITLAFSIEDLISAIGRVLRDG